MRVDVQVLNGDDLVTDLRKEDFNVFDQGLAQQLSHFGRESEPLSLLLVLDVSGSMRKYIEQVAVVARQSLRFMRPRDRVAVMVFARNSRVRLDFTSNMSAVTDEIREAVWDESLGSGTAINDALITAAKHMERKADDTGRKAVLMITDNLGLNYRNPDESVVEAMFGADTVVNAIVVGRITKPEPPRAGHPTNPDFTQPDVFKISEETGGEAVTANKAGEAFARMIERIRTRYSLAYRKPEGAKGFRRISVELSPSARLRYPQAALRARRGYQADR